MKIGSKDLKPSPHFHTTTTPSEDPKHTNKTTTNSPHTPLTHTCTNVDTCKTHAIALAQSKCTCSVRQKTCVLLLSLLLLFYLMLLSQCLEEQSQRSPSTPQQHRPPHLSVCGACDTQAASSSSHSKQLHSCNNKDAEAHVDTPIRTT